jgi:hypothetical protein
VPLFPCVALKPKRPPAGADGAFYYSDANVLDFKISLLPLGAGNKFAVYDCG